MTKKHDELVEAVRLLWCLECADGPLHSGVDRIYSEGWERVCATGAEELCRERARKVIALILSAVRDGRLNIPGDIGELSVGALRDITEDDLQFDFELWAWGRSMVKNGADIFIALTGTSKGELVGGKEEEVLETKNIPRYCEHCGSEEHYTSEH